MKFVTLTDPDGNKIWVVPHWVTKVKLPTRGQHHSSSQALIVTGNTEQAVRETPEEVVKALEDAHDG